MAYSLLRLQQGFPFLSFGSFQCFIYDVSRLFFRCANFLSILLDFIVHSNFPGNRNRNKQRDYYSNEYQQNCNTCTHYRSTSLFSFHCTFTTLQFYTVFTNLSMF